ncbi:MAG: SDR family oxidoreductase [Chitinophagaceae bacterium]
MIILVTGANGFVGYYLVEQLLQKGHTVLAAGKGECRLPFERVPGFRYLSMDFTDPFAVHDVFEKHHPEVVVHAGAIGKPDECELNQWQAYLVNVEGTVTLLTNAAEQQSFFVFISTDFVFDGEKGMYTEEDQPAPISFYGKTKWEAEQAVQEYEYPWAIVRTVLVYGKPASGRSNILTVVKDKLEKGEPYNVVDDQVRTPTYVEDLAAGIAAIIGRKAAGIYHLSGEDVLTPYQMACQVAACLGLDASLLKKVTAAGFSQPARRPPRTGFVIDKAKRELDFSPVPFAEGLKKTFTIL